MFLLKGSLAFLFLLLSFGKSEANVYNAGYQSVNHSFETVSKALSLEVEESYELFILINSAEGPTKLGAFIPNQHMTVVKKDKNAKRVFERNSEGVITGVQPDSLFLKDLLDQSIYQRAFQNNKHGKPFEWDGLESVPVSTGTNYFMPTFSGVFRVNWQRSLARHSSDFSDPMSNQLYLGYYYHDDSIPRELWTPDRRDRVSYAAVHGTPQENWNILGRSRGSHGCARLHPRLMQGLYNLVKNMPEKNVIDLSWDYELPKYSSKNKLKKRKPVLIIVFDGYEAEIKSTSL
jgi:hypothetical protein